MYDLTDLFFVVIALNEKTSPPGQASRQFRVTRQHHAGLALADANELVVAVFVRIQDIETQDSKPARKSSDHNVCNEGGFRHGII
jgi:hypothetical protein